MRKWRFGLRIKLLFFSSFLFAIPYLGYQYVWELEAYLRIGQEQTMLGTARSVATALHERPKLFNAQSSFNADVIKGKDLYAHKVTFPIQLDGELADWRDYTDFAIEYSQENLTRLRQPYDPASLKFTHVIGEYEEHLYAMFDVTDDALVYRARNNLKIDRNDYLQISMIDLLGEFQRYMVAPMQEGWVNAFQLEDNYERVIPAGLETRIQGFWKPTDKGYVIELRFPLAMMQSRIAFAISDVDDQRSGFVKYSVGTANPDREEDLGTVLVPSPEIEDILRGLQYTNARVWVIDKHKRVLAKSGRIQDADGFEPSFNTPNMTKVDDILEVTTPGLLGPDYANIGRSNDRSPTLNGDSVDDDSNANNSVSSTKPWYTVVEEDWLLPLYYRILTEPPKDFVDDLEKAYALQGQDVDEALMGEASSLWRLSSDNKAVILSAAHPIFIDGEVMGAVVIEQTTNGIRTLRNQALEKQFHFFLGVIVLGTLALFLLASHISSRVRKLRNDTEQAIDSSGKIISSIQASTTQDEIGDLSRTFSTVLSRLSQYNAYLENMAARLSHELRTPVAIVNSSLDNLLLKSDAKTTEVSNSSNDNSDERIYIERAKQGITRLSKILNNMSEATRLEQAIQSGDVENFDATEVLTGCVEGYKLAYTSHRFELKVDVRTAELKGSPELFAQMLDKIVANAVEFSSRSDPIKVSCENNNKSLTIRVANTGPLLPENMQNELLDSMISVRDEKSTVTHAEGNDRVHLGLGLYIAKIIALFHDGSIKIENQKDQSGVMVCLYFNS